MGLSQEQQNQIVRLLERESSNEISAILRSASAFLGWLADVVDAAEVWQEIRGMFI
jgi:hypothetical protein